MRRFVGAGLPAAMFVAAALGAGEPDEGSTDGPAMTTAVICDTIDGFRKYEPRAKAVVSRDEKMLVYYEVSGHTVEPTKHGFRAHLVQDTQVRRAGDRRVLQKKEKMVDYDVKSKTRPDFLYMENRISVKSLPPGKYELDIILHDALAKDSTSKQSLTFEVLASKPAPEPEPSGPATKDADPGR